MRRALLSLSQFAVFFLSLFGGFLTRVAPPEDDGQFWTGLATVIAGAAFLLVRLKSQTLYQPQRERRFYRLALLVLPVSIALFVWYHWLIETRSAKHNDARVVIGTELTARGMDQKAAEGLSNDELLDRNAGNPQGIWTENSISKSRVLVGFAYALAVGMLALGLIGGCQGLKDST